MEDEPSESSKIPGCDSYFETIQSKKMLPLPLQESLTAAFAQIPVSSFPGVPGGKVIEISGDASILSAVQTLSENGILAAPLRNPEAGSPTDWRGRYLGVLDYSAIVLWVLENVELAAVASSAESPTTAGTVIGDASPLGPVPVVIAGSTIGELSAERASCKNVVTTGHYEDDFYKVLWRQEPFLSTKVQSILKSYCWAPFLPVELDSSMLTVMLLLSKYRLRNVPVVEPDEPFIKNFITQTAVLKGLQQCRGRDWFDYIAAFSIADFGLPFLSYNEVITVKSDDMILEAFKRMNENKFGGLPVVEGPKKKLIGTISIRDIRFLLLRPDLFSNFRQLTVMDFVKTLQSEIPDSGSSSASPPVTCAPDDSLGSVIDSLAQKPVHRIYVIEGDMEVVGVVTLRDVISCFVYEPPGYFDNYLGLPMDMFENKEGSE